VEFFLGNGEEERRVGRSIHGCGAWRLAAPCADRGECARESSCSGCAMGVTRVHLATAKCPVEILPVARSVTLKRYRPLEISCSDEEIMFHAAIVPESCGGRLLVVVAALCPVRRRAFSPWYVFASKS